MSGVAWVVEMGAEGRKGLFGGMSEVGVGGGGDGRGDGGMGVELSVGFVVRMSA